MWSAETQMLSSSEIEASRERVRAVVRGRVQGVGYRYAAQERALGLGLAGYVRNRWDGTVEVVAEGARDRLDLFVRWLHRGPRLAQVTEVELTWEPPTGGFDTFEVRF